MSDKSTPETDAKEAQFRATWLHQHAAPSQWLIVTADEMTVLKENKEQLESERDAARAEAKEATEERDAALSRAALHEYSHKALLARITIEEEKLIRTELATLRAQSQDHRAAIEAAAKALLLDLYHDGQLRIVDQGDRIRIERNITKHMRALVATVTNSQLSAQGGGQTCNRDEESSSLPKSDPSAVASDPEGAATPATDAKRLAERIVKHIENGILYEVGASHVSIVRDVFEKWIREAIEHHAIQQATWHCETLSKLEAAAPLGATGATMTLAQEIAIALYPKRDDERQYPMFLAYRERAERTVESVLSRQPSPSVTEAAREIVRLPSFDLLTTGGGKEALHQAESILTRLRAQDAEELRRHKAAIEVARDALEHITNTKWGYDGDCGVNHIAEDALAAIDKELKP